MQNITPIVKNLIIINVILYFGLKYGLAMFHADRYMFLLPWGEGFNPYQLFSHMFMHGSEKHLFFNMLTLFFLGPMVEKVLGPSRFIFLYISAGLAGGIAHLITSPAVAVGASGAINGVLVAFGTMFPNLKLMLFPIPFEIKAKYIVAFGVLVDFFYGVTNINTGVAHFAHLGGVLVGFILIYYWRLFNLH